jgi:hypothetical protein
MRISAQIIQLKLGSLGKTKLIAASRCVQSRVRFQDVLFGQGFIYISVVSHREVMLWVACRPPVWSEIPQQQMRGGADASNGVAQITTADIGMTLPLQKNMVTTRRHIPANKQ